MYCSIFLCDGEILARRNARHLFRHLQPTSALPISATIRRATLSSSGNSRHHRIPIKALPETPRRSHLQVTGGIKAGPDVVPSPIMPRDMSLY